MGGFLLKPEFEAGIKPRTKVLWTTCNPLTLTQKINSASKVVTETLSNMWKEE
jgi:hypothetical protein